MLPQCLRRMLLIGSLLLLVVPFARSQESTRTPEFRGLPVRSALGDAAIEKRVESLLKQMTLEEKVGQLVQYSVGAPTGPGTGRGDYQDMVAKGQVGSLFNLEDAASANKYQHIAVETIAATHSSVVWLRRDSRIPDGISCSVGIGFDLGPAAHRKGGATRGSGGLRIRSALDVFADGGYRARCTLGPDD